MKKLTVLALFLGLALLNAPSASAFTLLNNYSGALSFKFSDFSTGNLYQSSSNGYGQANLNDPNDEDGFGIFKISTIQNPLLQTLWFDGKDGEELTGMYYGLHDDFWVVDANGINIQSVGGIIDVYLDNTPDFNPSAGPGGRVGGPGTGNYPTATDGALFLRLAMVPGIKYGDANPANDHITYDNNLDATTSPFTGDGAFYLEVIGGSHAYLFDTNIHCLTDDSANVHCVDFFGQFDTTAPGSFGWLVNSQDPISGAANAVPEPGTMALLASGLGMMGLRLRKKS